MDNRTLLKCTALLDIIDIIGIALVLSAAFVIQFGFGELPCPLCLLQRLGILAMAVGPVMNLRYGIQPLHYALSILAAVFTLLVSLRQIALHVLPGTGAYGMALFGLHLYVWVFILALAAIVYFTLAMAVCTSLITGQRTSRAFKRLGHAAFALLLFSVAANATSTFFECGIQQCPDNPEHYLACATLVYGDII